MSASVCYNYTESEGSTEDEQDANPIALSTTGSLNGQIRGQILNFRLPCTATEDTPCQIVDHLSAWNEFFCLASWQLKEVPGTSAKLSLAFFRDANPKYCSSQQRHLATLLACELLKSHRCVSHVAFDMSLSKAHIQILSDALRGSLSITSVKLAFWDWANGEDLAMAALSLPHLRELKYSGCAPHSPTLVARLSSFLQTTTSLCALKLSKDCPRSLCWEDFFQGLKQNCSLKELVLPSHLIAEATPRAQAAFTEWLTKSVSLKCLTAASTGWEYVPLKSILGAMLANRSVVAVVIDSPELDQSDVEFVSKIFEENEGFLDKADSDRCLKALIANHTLEEVALPIDVWDEGQWKQLFEVLPTKENLKKVTIEALCRAPRFLVHKLCTALKETGADDKVCFSAFFTEKVFDERNACKAFSFLGATHTLKTLALSASVDMLLFGFQESLMNGLARNRSLREVRIEVERATTDFSTFTKHLADAISASKNISRVYLSATDSAERAFYRKLSTVIADNYTLLSVSAPYCTYSKFKKCWFKVWDTTRRNCGLLTNAADFARGARRDRDSPDF
ncbi:hypothetical protein HPB48_011771 [Haemaphysalis longicornis]|uniref:Uncharacterized protein n=1 Tax=Haemaphysalis longicornis TaxID=44386 RepID=A0A9J6GKN2_HAELO|nr:hypothetical protein HPB48_011771 [Haemaphysalis longicornis]